MDYRIGLIDANELVRSGRAMVFNSQDSMRVVFEESDPLVALERAPDYLVDVLVVGPSQHRLRGDQFIQALINALRTANNDCAVLAYNAYSDSRLRYGAILSGAQEFIGLDETADRFIRLVKQVAKRDFIIGIDELRQMVRDFGSGETNARLEMLLAGLTDQQSEIVSKFMTGLRDSDIAKEFDIARTRVTQLIDLLIKEAGFTTRNQLLIYLLGGAR